jgi:hypothetical protein
MRYLSRLGRRQVEATGAVPMLAGCANPLPHRSDPRTPEHRVLRADAAERRETVDEPGGYARAVREAQVTLRDGYSARLCPVGKSGASN